MCRFGTCRIIVLAITLLAAYTTARRGSRINPMQTFAT
jgi:ABC-type lipoprotein release transport system permease subunit